MYKMTFLTTESGHRGMPPARAGQQNVCPSPHCQMLLDSAEIRIRNILDLADVWFWLTAFLLWIKGLSVCELLWRLSDVWNGLCRVMGLVSVLVLVALSHLVELSV